MNQSVSRAAPLAGVKVVEISSFMMTPVAGALLAAHGADVVKIERAQAADPMQRLNMQGVSFQSGYELANNAKRCIHLNLSAPGANEIVQRLLANADVLLTNVRTEALRRADLDPEELSERYPRLIIAHGTGYGPNGPESGRAAFDELAYWARSGIASALQVEGQQPVSLVGALGDLPSGVSLVAGILMALLRRERDQRGGLVDVSLYQCGIWANAGVIAQALAGAPPREKRTRANQMSPLYTSYQCAGGEWIQLAMMPPMRYWRTVCTVLGRGDLLEDERFATFEALSANSSQAIAELEPMFGELSRKEIGVLFDAHDLPWSPIYEVADVTQDAQARANGYIRSKLHRSGDVIETIGPPFSLLDFEPIMEPAPESGQHTEEVLLELGYTWGQISSLRDADVF